MHGGRGVAVHNLLSGTKTVKAETILQTQVHVEDKNLNFLFFSHEPPCQYVYCKTVLFSVIMEWHFENKMEFHIIVQAFLNFGTKKVNKTDFDIFTNKIS